MIINVITINLATGKTHDERTCRLNTIPGQKWLIGHMNWAMSNNHGLQMHNVADKPPC